MQKILPVRIEEGTSCEGKTFFIVTEKPGYTGFFSWIKSRLSTRILIKICDSYEEARAIVNAKVEDLKCKQQQKE